MKVDACQENSVRRIMARRPIFFAAVSFLFGLLLGGKMEVSSIPFFAIAGVFLVGALLCRHSKFAALLALVCIFFAGMGAMRLALTVDYAGLDLQNGAIIEGRVEKKTQKEGYTLYRLGQVKISGKSVRGGVFLSSQSDYDVDDLLISQANPRIPERADYPLGFDDFLYCRSQGVLLRATSTFDAKTGQSRDISAVFHTVNRWMAEKIDSLFENAPLVRSLLIGDNGELDSDDAEQFEQAGIGHILSVSGVYLFLYAKALESLLLFFRVSKKWRDGAGILLFAVFLLIFGANTAVFRIAVFYGLTKLASILWKEYDELTLLSISFLAAILFQPAKVYDLGVQYSYAAVFSLICLMPYIERGFAWLQPAALRKALGSVICLNIGLLPLIIRQENAIWIFSLLSNLFATLYLAVLLPVLTCFTLLYGLFGNAVAFLGNLGDALLAVLERFAGHAEAWESARLILPSPNSAILLFWFMLLFLLSHRVYLNWKPRAACSAVMVAVYVLASVLPGIQQSAQVRIDFLNADGPSIVVRAENGNCALLGTAAGRNSAEYIVKNGLSVQYALCISKDEDSIKGIEQLNSYGCAGEVLADPQVARVLGERSGIVCTQIEDFSIALSPRCHIRIFYGKERNFIEHLFIYIDDKPACAILLWEDAPDMEGNFPVLYWEAAVSTPLPEDIEYQNLILRIPQWGVMAPYGVHGDKAFYNLYEAGTVSAVFGRKLELEAMYGSS